MLFSFLGVSVSFLQKHFCLNICYGNILLHFGLKAVKIHKVSKKCFLLPTSNRFAILNNPLMQLQIIFKKTLIKQSIEAAIQRCSENMQQIYRRTPMPKCDRNFIEILLRHRCSPVNFLHIFRASFQQNTSGQLLLKHLHKTIDAVCSLVCSKTLRENENLNSDLNENPRKMRANVEI